MKKTDFIIISVALAVIAFYGGHWLGKKDNGAEHDHSAHGDMASGEAQDVVQQFTCGMHPMIVTDGEGLCPICGMELTPLKSGTGGGEPKGEREVLYYVAPMDPTYISETPGKSPMGMDLVPVYEDDAPGGSVISVDPVVSQNMGIRTEMISKRVLQRTIRTVGLVEYEEPKQFTVTPKIGGYVEKLYVNEIGQHVKKGQPLLALYSPELVAAQEEFLVALENSDKLAGSTIPEISAGAERLLEASRRRLQLWDITKRQIERLETSRNVEKNLTLYAPYAGIVTSKQVVEGAFIKPGMPLLQVADLSRVWVQADIYEHDLPLVATGQPVQVELPFLNGRVVEARIDYLYPYVEPRTRTVKARIDLDNPGLDLRPDMFVNVNIVTDTLDEALAVPKEAILDTGQKQTVFIAHDAGRFEPRLVKPGLRSDDGYVQIEQGLFEGEQVVVSGQFMLDSESQVREALRKMRQPEEIADSSGEDDHEDLFGDDEEDLDDLFEED